MNIIETRLSEFDLKVLHNEFQMEDVDDEDLCGYYAEDKLKAFIRESMELMAKSVIADVEKVEFMYKDDYAQDAASDTKGEILYQLTRKYLTPDITPPTEQYKCQSYVERGKVIDCTCGKCF